MAIVKNLLLAGIGNALVDIEYQVTDEELAAFGVDKGGMMLTDPARQLEMIKELGERKARRSSGGSVANSIIAFAQFGGSAGFSSLLGKDSMGEFYAKEFKDLGIVLDAEEVPEEVTGTCLVLISPDHDRTLNTTLAVNSQYSPSTIDEDLIKRSEWLFIEGYKLTDDSGAEAVDKAAFYAKKHDTRIAVSCSDKFIIDVFGDQLNSILKQSDLVFCNEMEGMALSQEGDGASAYASLRSRYSNVIFTMSEKGSRIKWNGRECEAPAYKVEAVDTTGAGDMYAGAFLYGVLSGHSPEHASRLASYASAQVVAQYGARLKTSHIEVRDSILTTSPTID